MRSPVFRISAAAILVLAIGGIAVWFHGGGTTPAFANFVEPILNAKTVTFTMTLDGKTAGKVMAIASPQRVVDFALMKMAGLPHEAFLALFLNIQNEVIHHEILNEGTVDQVAVYPRRILEKALARHAAGLIIVHNHPSGDAEPSREDVEISKRLARAGELLGIPLLDHVIVARGGYASLRERGVL